MTKTQARDDLEQLLLDWRRHLHATNKAPRRVDRGRLHWRGVAVSCITRRLPPEAVSACAERVPQRVRRPWARRRAASVPDHRRHRRHVFTGDDVAIGGGPVEGRNARSR